MHSADPMHFGARWCEEDRRWECISPTKRHGICHNWPIRGTDKCRMHVGKKGDIAKAEGEAMITAWSAIGQPGIDQSQAVMAVLHMTWLRLHLIAELLRKQVEADTGQPELGKGKGAEESGSGTSGLIGYTYSGVKDIGIFATSEAARALVRLEAEERDKVVRYAKAAHEMGISERHQDFIERQAAIAADVLKRIVEGLLQALIDAGMTDQLVEVFRSSYVEIAAREQRVLMAVEGEVIS